MKALGLNRIPVGEIDDTGRLRPVDPAYVAMLAENLAQTLKLRQPIEVRRLKKGGYRLIAGAHRLAAVKAMGWPEIDAFVYEATDAEARLAEIDENLVRHELNPLDRAVFLAERKAIYEALHPETKAGVAGGKARQGSATDIMSFARDTAERIGLNDRTIQRAVMIATKLAPDVKAAVAGTWIAKHQGELLALAKQPPADQRACVALMLKPEAPARTVADALRQSKGVSAAGGGNPDDKAFEGLISAWGRAGAKAKRRFLERIQATGELTVFLQAKAAATPDDGEAR